MESLFCEPADSQGLVHDRVSTHALRAFAAPGRHLDPVAIDPERQQSSPTGAWPAPLFRTLPISIRNPRKEHFSSGRTLLLVSLTTNFRCFTTKRFTLRSQMTGLRCVVPAHPTASASYEVFVHRLVVFP